MRCFIGGGTRRCPSSPPPPPPPSAVAVAVTTTVDGDDEEEAGDCRRRIDESDSGSKSAPASIASASTSPASATTINLRREYTLAVQTNSYNEIWSKIHHNSNTSNTNNTGGEADEVPRASASASSADDDDDLIDRVLQPDRASIQEALRTARPTRLITLLSRYLDSSEHTSHLFLSLRRSVDRARSIYAPIADLLTLLPTTDLLHPQLSQSQCDWAFHTFLAFVAVENPFPAPSAPGDASCSFDGLRCCFAELKQQLDARLLSTRRRHRLLHRATCGSAACLIGSAAGVIVTGLVIATHALAALVVACGPAAMCGRWDVHLARQRRRLREHSVQVDAAARETYVLNNNLDTIERLVARLHARVESDKVLVRLGVERGPPGSGQHQHHPILEVVRHLHKNHPSFLHQLTDLDEHICLCLAAVNRARSLLLHQIHCSSPT